MVGYEHALFMLLLLCYLLQEVSSGHPINIYLIAAGLLLAFVPPVIRFEFNWNLILALILPLIFWRTGKNWLDVERRVMWRELSLWLVTMTLLTLIVAISGNLPWTKAIFFGIVTASLFWQASGREGTPNILGSVGALTLVFLLVETSFLSAAPDYFPGSLFSGSGIGIACAAISIVLCKKAPSKYHEWFSLGQVYLAYWIALAINASAIAASLVCVVVFNRFQQIRSYSQVTSEPRALKDYQFPFYIALVAFIFTTWQIHQPLDAIQWFEVALSVGMGVLIAVLGRRIGVPVFKHAHLGWQSFIQPGLFQLGIWMLWPRTAALEPIFLWIALGSAIFLPILATILIAALHDLKNPAGKNPLRGL